MDKSKLTGYARFKPMQEELIKLKEDNAALLAALKDSQHYLEIAINATPTGAIRNILTEANMGALTAIKKVENK